MKREAVIRRMLLLAACLMVGSQPVAAQFAPPDQTDAPESVRYRLVDLHDRLTFGTNAPKRSESFAGPLSGPTAPASVNLAEVLDLTPQMDAFAASDEDVRQAKGYWSLAAPPSWGRRQGAMPERTLNPAAASMPAGYYEEQNLAVVAPALIPGNILTNRSLFGIHGAALPLTNAPAPVPKTGASLTNWPYADGFYQRGVPWPSDRFVVLDGIANNCVRDTLTGLMWLRNPSTTFAQQSFANAVASCLDLDGNEGRGGFEDWRLPNIRELESLIAYWTSTTIPIVPTDIFSYNNIRHWSSTLVATDSSRAWFLDFQGRRVATTLTNNQSYAVWPVRGP